MSSFGCVGDNTIDQYVGADDRSFVGGNALNVAMQLRLAGHTVRYAGGIGADANGQRVRTALEGHAVITEGLVVLPGVTSVSRIRVRESGDRVMESEDFAVCADYRPTNRELDELAQCSFVHIGMTPFADEIRAALHDRGARISQDCAVSDGFDRLDIAFCSAGEDVDAGRTLIESALAGGARFAIATCGAEGSIASDGENWTRQVAQTANVIDTTGAGDSFAAGFVAEFARGHDIRSCMRAGSAAAAITCQHKGGWPQ